MTMLVILQFILYFTFCDGTFCEYCNLMFLDARGCSLLQEATSFSHDFFNRHDTCFDEAIAFCWQNTCTGDCSQEFTGCCKDAFDAYGGCSTIRGTDSLSNILLDGCELCSFTQRRDQCVQEGYPEFAPIVNGYYPGTPPEDVPTGVVHSYDFIPCPPPTTAAPSAAPTQFPSRTVRLVEEESGTKRWEVALISMICAIVGTGICCAIAIWIYRKYSVEQKFELYAFEEEYDLNLDDKSMTDDIQPLTPRTKVLYVRKGESKKDEEHIRRASVSRRISRIGPRDSNLFPGYRTGGTNLEMASVSDYDMSGAWSPKGDMEFRKETTPNSPI